jgi:nitrogen-specific signal transduction histidine kinase
MIECDSKPGHTRFAIYIPVAPTTRGKRLQNEAQDQAS